MVEGSCGVSVINFASDDLGMVSCLFVEKYVPHTLRDGKKDEFLALEQDNMSVATYVAKFHALSIYATQLLRIEE